MARKESSRTWLAKEGYEPTTKICRLFQLPLHLILDILSRLPINSLLHCRLHLSHIDFDDARLRYSTATNQYKLLQSYYPTLELNYPMAEIYTIGSGTWRSIGNTPTGSVSLPFNAFLNGALHWSKSSLGGEFINSFDFDTERFGIVPPPDHFQELDKESGDTTTGVLGGCLFIIHLAISELFEIWVVEYGVKESRTKHNGEILMLYNEVIVVTNSYLPKALLSSGQILYLTKKVIDFNNQKVKRLEETRLSQTRARFNAIAYTRCFISLYNVAKGERISRMQSTRVYDKICQQEFQDCTGCGDQASFPVFGVPHGAVNYHAELYEISSEI
ncbi:hypothetical protein ES288_A10G125100v1 [Gossypium darwinii]|uniref:F-box associated beta-propeller type 1 domain-containing protein n=2 Tax=Gossypium TaxID=3633 RepID=A0A5D2F1H4_GOSDA|nr:hypothetical protein ES288_A10G125100v1 [Gossypium darwinii]